MTKTELLIEAASAVVDCLQDAGKDVDPTQAYVLLRTFAETHGVKAVRGILGYIAWARAEGHGAMRTAANVIHDLNGGGDPKMCPRTHRFDKYYRPKEAVR